MLLVIKESKNVTMVASSRLANSIWRAGVFFIVLIFQRLGGFGHRFSDVPRDVDVCFGRAKVLGFEGDLFGR